MRATIEAHGDLSFFPWDSSDQRHATHAHVYTLLRVLLRSIANRCVYWLIGIGLVRIHKHPTNTSNVVCLARHDQACQRSLSGDGSIGAGAIKTVMDALRAARNHTLIQAEVRRLLGMRGNKHKTRWGQTMAELSRSGVTTVRAEVEGREHTCLYLASSSVEVASAAPEGSGTSSTHPGAGGTHLLAEDTLERQIYDMVVATQGVGITHTDVNARLGVPTKMSYMVCCRLIGLGALRAVPETIKSQVHYRMIAPEHYRAEQFDVGPKGASNRHSTATVQQQRRRSIACDRVNEVGGGVWLRDLLKWMQTQPPGDAALDKKVLTRTVKELHTEKLIQMVTCSVPVSVDRKKDLIALFPIGTSLSSPAAQEFISAAAFKRREVAESKLPLHNVAVEHLPGVNADKRPQPLAALSRVRR